MQSCGSHAQTLSTALPKYTWWLHNLHKQLLQVHNQNTSQAAQELPVQQAIANVSLAASAASVLRLLSPHSLLHCETGITCRMRVPIVMAPCGVLVDLVSDRHLITMDVDDMDTCSQRMSSWSDECRR